MSRTRRRGRLPAPATCDGATSIRERLERVAVELDPVAIAFVGKEAYRGLFNERPELGPQWRTLGPTALYVLPSTSPANAAVPYDERLRWFRALKEWLEPVQREAVRALLVDADERIMLVQYENPVTHATWWGTPGGGVEPGEDHPTALRRELREELGLEEFDAGPLVWTHERTFPWAQRLMHQVNDVYLVRVRRARAAADDRSRGGGRRQLPLVDARRDRGDRRARDAARLLEARAYDPQRVTAVLVVVHLLAATVWVGGSTALIFVGVPAIRTLEGEPRGRAMKELGLRWRPLGYGSLLVAGVTGAALAARDWESERRVPDRLLGQGRARRLPGGRLVPAQLRARPAPAGRDPRGPRADDAPDAGRRRLGQLRPDADAADPRRRVAAHGRLATAERGSAFPNHVRELPFSPASGW